MKINVLVKIEDGNSQKVEVEAFGKDTAGIFVTADTLQNAQALISQAESTALEAMKNWQPKEEPAKEQDDKSQKHYSISDKSIEEMDEDTKAFEETPAGKRFVKQIETSKAFCFKECKKRPKGGLRTEQLIYLANRFHNNFLNASFVLSALEYRRGYMHGKKAAK